jgi:hypothetical protein
MFFDPLGAIASIIGTKMAVNQAGKITDKVLAETDEWYRFGMSLFGSAFCSFFGTWGTLTPTLFASGMNLWPALVMGFCGGLATMAAVVYALWVRSPLTKGMPLMVPTTVQTKAIETDTVYTEKPK